MAMTSRPVIGASAPSLTTSATERWPCSCSTPAGPDRDKLDRATLAGSLADRELHYSHRGSRDELLLSLPDAVGWAVGAGAPFRAIIEPITTIRPC